MSVIISNNVASSTATAFANGKKIAIAPNGRIWAVYEKLVSGVFNIYAAYSDNNGSTWTEETVTASLQGQRRPSIAVDSQGVVHVVWQGRGWGTNTTIENIRYAKRTTSWQTSETVTDVNNTQRESAIAVDSQDNIYIVWAGRTWGSFTNRYNIQYRKKTISWQAQESVTDANGDQKYPSLAIDSLDNIHVAFTGLQWGNFPSSDNVQYRKRTTSWQAQIGITDINNQQFELNINVDSNNDAHIVWAGLGWNSNPNINNVQYIKQTNGIFQSIVELTDTDKFQDKPSIALKNSNVYVVWQGYDQDNRWNIFSKTYNVSWGNIEPVTVGLDNQFSPSIALNNPILAWTGRDGTPYNVYFANLKSETALNIYYKKNGIYSQAAKVFKKVNGVYIEGSQAFYKN